MNYKQSESLFVKAKVKSLVKVTFVVLYPRNRKIRMPKPGVGIFSCSPGSGNLL